MSESELIAKAKSLAPAGDSVSAAVLRLAADRDRLREALAGVMVITDEMALTTHVIERVRVLVSNALAKVPE